MMLIKEVKMEEGTESHVNSSSESSPIDLSACSPITNHVTESLPPISPVSTDIDNLGSCPCCYQDLTVSLVHHNTGLITCNNLDCIYPFNQQSILSHFVHIPTNRILRETAHRMKSLENLSQKTIGIIDRDLGRL